MNSSKTRLKANLGALLTILLLLVSTLPVLDLTTPARAESNSVDLDATDEDGDGLLDEEEEELGTNPELKDTDEDGISDYDEVNTWKTNPTRESTDGDRYDDGMEIFGHSPVGLGELGGDMPGYVKGAGKSPFVAAYPEIDFEISDEIELETLAEITYSYGTISSDTYGYATSVTQGTSISVSSTEGYTKNNWIEVSNEQQDIQQKREYTDTVTNTEEKYWNGWTEGKTVETEIGGSLEGGASMFQGAYVKAEVHANWKETVESGSYGNEYKGTSVRVNKGGEETSTRILKSGTISGAGEESSFSTTVTQTSYTETSVTNTKEMTQGEEWGEASTTDTNKAAELRFFFYIKNTGTDIARDVEDLRFNIFIGNDLFPITYPALTDQGGNTNPGLSFSNVLPGQKRGQFTAEVFLSLEQVRAIDNNGENIRIRIVDYTFGEDQLYYENAWGNSVLFEIDDGVADGDESIDKYMIATWGNETYIDVLRRYLDVELFQGVISSIDGYEVSEWSWWNVYTQESSGKEYFVDEPAVANTRVLLVYYQDTDRDSYPDRIERKIGTSTVDASEFPAPKLVAGYAVNSEFNNISIVMKLTNLGNFDAYGIEIGTYLKTDKSKIIKSKSGGGGRVKPGEEIILETDPLKVENISDVIIEVRYNDLQGYKSFITQSEIENIEEGLSEYIDRMIYEPRLTLITLDDFWFHSSKNYVMIAFENPLKETIYGVNYHITYSSINGSSLTHSNYTKNIIPGSNVLIEWQNISSSWFDSVNPNPILVICVITDNDQNIIAIDVKKIRIKERKNLPSLAISKQDWSIDIVPENYQLYTIMNVGKESLSLMLVIDPSIEIQGATLFNKYLTDKITIDSGTTKTISMKSALKDTNFTILSNDPNNTNVVIPLNIGNISSLSNILSKFNGEMTTSKLYFENAGSKAINFTLPTDSTITSGQITIIPDYHNYTSDYEDTEEFSDSNGKKNSIDLEKSTARFVSDHYEIGAQTSTSFYVDIYASEISSYNDFEINGCKIFQYNKGKWRLYKNEGGYEENRASVYKTLFFGTNGGDPRVTDTYVKSLSALKTPDERDIGKKAFYAYLRVPINGPRTYTYTGTFSDTVNNENVSSWSIVATRTIETISDETTSDTSSDIVNNPSNMQLDVSLGSAYARWEIPSGSTRNSATGNSGGYIYTARVFFLSVGFISWVATGGDYSETDFNQDQSIPILSRVDPYSSKVHLVTKSKTIFDSINSVFITAEKEEYNSTTITYDLSTDDGTTWDYLNQNLDELVTLKKEINRRIVIRFILTSENPNETPKLSTYIIKYWTTKQIKITQVAEEAAEDVYNINNYNYNISEKISDSDGENNLIDIQNTSALFNHNSYGLTTITSTSFYVDIYASSLTSVADFQINGCKIFKYDTGKWRLYKNDGSYEENRASVYKTLFFGTNGGDPRVTDTYVKSLLALKTPDERDIGKKAFYAYLRVPINGPRTYTYTGTFSDTVNNENVSSWSIVATRTIGTISDETTSDTSSDIVNNPSNMQLDVSLGSAYARWEIPSGSTRNSATGNSGGYIYTARVFLLSKGNISWTATGGDSGTIDFNQSYSIPTFTAIEEYYSSAFLYTSKIELRGIETQFSISANVSVPEYTSFTVDVSSEQGDSWDYYNLTLDDYYDTDDSSFLIFRFNLTSWNPFYTPSIYDFEVTFYSLWSWLDTQKPELTQSDIIVPLNSEPFNVALSESSSENTTLSLIINAQIRSSIIVKTLELVYYRKSELPDLIISKAHHHSVGDVVIEGEIVNASFSIRNLGKSNVSNFIISLHLIFNGNETLINHIPITTNLPSNSESDNISFNLSTKNMTGNYSIIISVDRKDNIIEGNELNNYKEIPLSILPKPDLKPISIKVRPLKLIDNQEVNLTCVILNHGAAAKNYTVEFFYGNPNQNGLSIGKDLIDSHYRDKEVISSVKWIPSKGISNIYVVVDSYDNITESNESNNEMSKQMRVAYRPDISIASLNISNTKVVTDDLVVIRAVINNNGDVDAKNVSVELSVDNDPVETATVSNLRYNESTSVSFTWLATAGLHNIEVMVDPSNAILEVNESNNIATTSIYVKRKADLVPVDIQFSKTSPSAGEDITISALIENSGELNAPAVMVRILVDNFVMEETTLSSIPAGQSRTVWADWEAVSGQHTIKVIVNIDDNVDESNVSNNVLTAGIMVREPPDETPVANAGEDVTATVGSNVIFAGSGYDPDGDIVMYEWDFDGDGVYDWNSSEHAITTHSFAVPGLFSARLRVTDDEGASSTDVVAVLVKPAPQPTEAALSGLEIVTLASSPSAGDWVVFQSSFTNSGSAAAEGLDLLIFIDGQLKSQKHFDRLEPGQKGYMWLTWQAVGGQHSIVAQLVSSMSNVRIDNETAILGLKVSSGPNVAPSAIVTKSITSFAGEMVILEADVSDPDGWVVKYEWDFDGDGAFEWESTDSPVVAHLYNETGIFYAKLRVTDDGGAATTETTLVNIKQSSQSSDDGNAPEAQNVESQSISPAVIATSSVIILAVAAVGIYLGREAIISRHKGRTKGSGGEKEPPTD